MWFPLTISVAAHRVRPLVSQQLVERGGCVDDQHLPHGDGREQNAITGGEPRRAVRGSGGPSQPSRSEEHTSELQSRENLVCRLLLEKKKKENKRRRMIT